MKKQKKIIPSYESTDYETRTSIKIVPLPQNHFSQNLGINFVSLQNIVFEQAKSLPFKEDVLQALAKAVHIRLFSLIRTANVKKNFRLRTNANITSIPKINFILLNAEQNMVANKQFPNEEIPDDETKQFVNSLIEGKKYRIQENTPKGIVQRKFPPNIKSLIPHTEQSQFITPYDIFASLDDDRFASFDQKRLLYDLKYFEKHSEEATENSQYNDAYIYE